MSVQTVNDSYWLTRNIEFWCPILSMPRSSLLVREGPMNSSYMKAEEKKDFIKAVGKYSRDQAAFNPD